MFRARGLMKTRMQSCGCLHLLTACSSLRDAMCSAGASMPSAVCLVRRRSLVHTFSPSILTSFMCRAKDCAYFLPRGERFASPPIRPKTLFSLSPCYINNVEKFTSFKPFHTLAPNKYTDVTVATYLYVCFYILPPKLVRIIHGLISLQSRKMFTQTVS